MKLSVLPVVLLLWTFAACSKHSNSPGQSGASLSITGYAPQEGYDSTAVTITGTNFGSNRANDSVFFNGKSAIIDYVADTILIARVPGLSGTGDLVVKTNGKSQTAGTFEYDTSYRISRTISNLANPAYLALDSEGNIYVTQFGGSIRKIDTLGTVKTFANFFATGIAIDNHNNLFAAVSNHGSYDIVKIDPAGDTSIIAADTSFLLGLAVDTSDNLYVGNSTANRFESITPDGHVSIIASGLFSPSGVAATSNGTVYGLSYSIHEYANAAGVVTAISPLGSISSFSTLTYDGDAGIWISGNNDLYVTAYNQGTEIGWVEKISPTGKVLTLPSPTLQFPVGIVVDKKGNIYVAQQADSPGAGTGSVIVMTPY